MPEAADGALCLIGQEDASSKFRLMEALFHDSFGVFAFGWFELQWVGDEAKAFVESEDKSSTVSIVCDYIDREDRHEDAWADGAQQDDWQPEFEGAPHLPVIAVGAACPVVVSVETVAYLRICVRAFGVGDHRQRGQEFFGVPDAAIPVNNSPLLVSDLKLFEFGPTDNAILSHDIGKSFEDQLAKMQLNHAVHGWSLTGRPGFRRYLWSTDRDPGWLVRRHQAVRIRTAATSGTPRR